MSDAPSRFVSMDMKEAHDACRPLPADFTIKTSCPRCKLSLLLHCPECKIQVTGCLCTEVDRFGNNEAWKRAVDRYGESLARERMKEAGLWVPEETS